MMEAGRLLTLSGLDSGEKPSVVTAILKCFNTEFMRRVVNDAMDVHGGRGICMGPSNYIGRAYQTLPVGITVEGANILTRSMIIFGQGAIRSHPYIFDEMSALDESDWDESVKKFDTALFGHIRFFINNFFRSFFHGLTAAFFALTSARGPARRYYQKLTRMSAVFALVSDLSLVVYGANLKRKEKISARLGDLLSYMYLSTAVLKRFETQGSLKEDVPLMNWSCEMMLYKMQVAIDGILQNFPNRPLAWLLRFIIFPYGQRFKPPTDKLGHRVAQLLLSPSQARDRLTRGMYIPAPDSGETVADLEDALIKVIKTEHIEKRLRQELEGYQPGYQVMENMLNTALEKHIITEDEANLLREAESARWKVIQVDDFSPDLK